MLGVHKQACEAQSARKLPRLPPGAGRSALPCLACTSLRRTM